MHKFPFKRFISFSKLLERMKLQENQNGTFGDYVRGVINELENDEVLSKNIDIDYDFSSKKELLEKLVGFVLPSAAISEKITGIASPFNFEYFYQTPLFRENVGIIMEQNKEHMSNGNEMDDDFPIIFAYSYILERIYNLNINVMKNEIMELYDRENDTKAYYQIEVDCTFNDIIIEGELKPLTDKEKELIYQNIMNVEVLGKILPINQFTFAGFTIINVTDITETRLIAEIKYDLLENNSLIDNEKFAKIEKKINALFKRKDLSIDIAAIRGKEVLILNSGRKAETNCIFLDSKHYLYEDFKGTPYETAVHEKRRIYFSNLESSENISYIEKEMISHGKKNAVIIPILSDDNVIGTIGISSTEVGTLNEFSTFQFEEIIPMIGEAIKRSLKNFEDTINNIIQTKFTSIHPAVEWRFRDAAVDILTSQKKVEDFESKPIVFEKVYPLYSVTDIRSSSVFRNDAIQKDLLEHLKLAKEIIDTSLEYREMPLLYELKYRIEKSIANISDGLDSGEELRVIAFLKSEVEPFFDDFCEFSSLVCEKVEIYKKSMESEVGTLYRKRRDFDKSVESINKAITLHVDKAQQKAQEMYPHYFDKQVTDGVDQSIYIGASLVKGKRFDKLYLKNLRLWQLITMCEIAVLAEKIKDNLAVKLETTHLIVVQDMPITICFDEDEKRFRVDGAYNIRYEIMKKRIDKATIKGNSERLTQPGKIAIVYSQANEEAEYLQYIEYLVSKGYLIEGYERMELEDLQGIRGLHAIRVGVEF